MVKLVADTYREPGCLMEQNSCGCSQWSFVNTLLPRHLSTRGITLTHNVKITPHQSIYRHMTYKTFNTGISFSMALPAHSGPWPLIQFRNKFSRTVGRLRRVSSSSQGLYLNRGQYKQNKRIHTPNIHALSGIRTHDTSVRASEESSCLRPRGYCDRR
jgi:hypothetical protein